MLAISTDDLSGAQSIADNIGIGFPILYDPEADVVREYGVHNPPDGGRAKPATFIIDRDGIIQWKYVGSGIGDRPSMQRILEQLALLN